MSLIDHFNVKIKLVELNTPNMKQFLKLNKNLKILIIFVQLDNKSAKLRGNISKAYIVSIVGSCVLIPPKTEIPLGLRMVQ
jgi:hypothetical protein